MSEAPEPRPRRKKIAGERSFLLLVNSLHGFGAIAAAFVTVALITPSLLSFFNLGHPVLGWLFVGLVLLLSLLLAILYTFGIGWGLDWLGRQLTQPRRRR